MPVAGHDLKVLSQVSFDGFGFGGGLYNDKIFGHKNEVLGLGPLNEGLKIEGIGFSCK
jgi:hypothetical protein